MIFPIVFLSLIFFAIAWIVTESNAKYLLSGYNTMTEEQRAEVDIKAYLSFFRSFHIVLALTLLAVGLGLYYFISANAAGIFLTIYPILAYIYFSWKSSKYMNGSSAATNKLAVGILVATLIFVLGLLAYGFKANELNVNNDGIVITGIYGERLLASDIQQIRLVDTLPKIRYKSNGYALGAIRKGYFKTSSGETVKLILNTEGKPILRFNYGKGKQLYYVDKEQSTKELLSEIGTYFPHLVNLSN